MVTMGLIGNFPQNIIYYILYIIKGKFLDTLTVNKNTIGGMVWNGRELSSKDLNKPFVKTRLKLRA